MITVENVTIYKCDFCKKELKRKHAMVDHESKCGANPINHRPCLNGCVHLDVKEIEYTRGDDYNGDPIYTKGNAFYCKLKDTFMLLPKVENESGLKWVHCGNEEVQQFPMPKECESSGDDLDFDKIFF